MTSLTYARFLSTSELIRKLFDRDVQTLSNITLENPLADWPYTPSH